MKSNKLHTVLNLLVLLALVLAACAPATPEAAEAPAAPTEEAASSSEEAPAATEEPASDRMGAWVDEVIFTEENSAEAAISQLNAGQLDIYAYTVAEAPAYETVQNSPELATTQMVGSSVALMVNPAEFNNGEFNPFANRNIREAMHWLINRDYVVQEIYKGLARPRFTVLTTVFPDYARYADIMRGIEAKYAYDLEKARSVVAAEMEGMGAELVDGKWSYNGKPIVLAFVIRTEDNRRPFGDYFATQLENIGFTVDRQFKTRSEASPIWFQSNPADGLWHLYTAGWISPSIDRDEGDTFAAYFTKAGSSSPLWQAYAPDARLDEVAVALLNNNFDNLEERRSLFEEAITLSASEAYQVWVVDEASFAPFVNNLSVAADLAGGPQGSQIWGQTIRFAGQEGGTVRIAQPGIMVEPWNPLGGTNWIYDSFPQRGLSDNAVISDPFTGLALPQRLERAEVVVQQDLPVFKTLDWVSLEKVSEIQVPADAWVDWDAANQRFITAGEKYPEGLTALTKSTVYYPEDLFGKVAWHDGSPLSVADFVLSMILVFDPSYPESAIYDEATVAALDAFLASFRGVRIVSTSPLVIETYSDAYNIDAEIMISNNQLYPNATWWPQYAFGEGAWHSIALGILAESNSELAFTPDKADTLSVEWMSFISGPSLEILEKYLDQAAAESYIPYAPTLGEYVTAEEAAERFNSLAAFYAARGHFWVNTGPFVLSGVFPVEGTLTLSRNPDYPDNATKWAGFGAPKIAVVEVDGPGQVTAGSPVTFDAFVSFEGEPYPSDEISEVKYLLFNASGQLVASGEAEAAGDGAYQVVLDAATTSSLETGASRIELIVVSKLVSIASFAPFEFVVTQ